MAINGLRTEAVTTERCLSSWEEKLISRLIPCPVDLSKAKEMEVSKELQTELVENPLMALSKAAEIKWGKNPTQEIFNSDEFISFVEAGFLNMLRAIARCAEVLPINLIVECGINEAIFTHALGQKPILVTDSLATCIGVAGYDRKNRWGFVIHIAGIKELEVSKELLVKKMIEMRKDMDVSSIEIHLRGGIKSYSEDIITSVERWIEHAFQKGCPMKIISKEVLTEGLFNTSGLPNSMSISLDTRDGRVGTYDREQNPYAKKKKEIKDTKEFDAAFSDAMLESLLAKQKIEVIYFNPPVTKTAVETEPSDSKKTPAERFNLSYRHSSSHAVEMQGGGLRSYSGKIRLWSFGEKKDILSCDKERPNSIYRP